MPRHRRGRLRAARAATAYAVLIALGGTVLALPIALKSAADPAILSVRDECAQALRLRKRNNHFCWEFSAGTMERLVGLRTYLSDTLTARSFVRDVAVKTLNQQLLDTARLCRHVGR